MTENTDTTRTYEALFGPDKTRTRRVVISVRVFDFLESKYIGAQEQTWSEAFRVLDYDKATDFDIIDFYESVLEAGKPVE